MRLIRFVFFSLLVLFFLFTALSLLFPSHQRISRAINIGATKREVIKQLRDLQSWDTWNHFTGKTPLTGKQVINPSGADTGRYLSEELAITVFPRGTDSVITNWKQKTGKSFTGGFACFQLRPDSITVQWYFDFHLRWYPWEKFTGMLYDQQFGPVMQESLADLKQVLEKTQ
jgi:hypothetical protein